MLSETRVPFIKLLLRVVYLLQLALAFLRDQRIRQFLVPAGLGRQLAITLPAFGINRAFLYGGLHGAALFARVRAIAKPAAGANGRDVLKYAVHALLAGP